jgi:hypothetical protein
MMRRCDACLRVESDADPRAPWYRVSVDEDGYTRAFDVCSGCHLRSLTSIHLGILKNINDGHVAETRKDY